MSSIFKIKRPDNTTVMQYDVIIFEQFYTTDGWYEIKEIDSPNTNELFVTNTKYVLCYNKQQVPTKYWSDYFNLSFDSKEEFDRAYRMKVFA